jgi:hypothetical protein
LGCLASGLTAAFGFAAAEELLQQRAQKWPTSQPLREQPASRDLS